MEAYQRMQLWVLAVVLAIPVIGAIVFFSGIWVPTDMSGSRQEVRQGLTLWKARGGCPIPLPDGAKNISYAKWAANFGVGFEVYVRFEAAPETCLAHVATVLKDSGTKGDRFLDDDDVPILMTINKPPDSVQSSQVDIWWFDVDLIRTGVTAGRGGSNEPTIWVDTDRGVFYYRLTD